MNFAENRTLTEILESSWKAQDFFNDYLQLKSDIILGYKDRDYYFRINNEEKFAQTHEELVKKVNALKFVLNQLKVVHGVQMEDLILLSVGVDV